MTVLFKISFTLISYFDIAICKAVLSLKELPCLEQTQHERDLQYRETERGKTDVDKVK